MNTSHSSHHIPHAIDPAAWMRQLTDPTVFQAWLQSQTHSTSLGTELAALNIALDPATVARLQGDYTKQIAALWQEMLASKIPSIGDRRFSAEEWQSKLHAFSAAAYLLNTQFLQAMADAVEAPAKMKQRIQFSVQQMADAMSPANFFATNPEAQKKIVESCGTSLSKGIGQLLADMKKGRISQSDESAFEVGVNVAATEGAVVFENALFQLIQYRPLTATVHERPLFMMPPCINKFYILDLQPANSLIRYAVEQGHTVFLVSWRNPDASMASVTWDDYIDDAAIKAIHLVQAISGQQKMNVFGFCVGGTMISTALAVLAARGEHPAASLTLLTSFLDFTDTGVLDVFIDEMQVSLREQTIGKGGLMPANDFSSTFSILRSNDLVWSYVKSNYLKGETPPPFDLLYWNADSTNMSGPMFCWYLRNMYLENNLRQPGKLTVAGEKVDLGAIDAPAFIYGSREDHIVPWMSAYASMVLLNPEKSHQNRFVLGASGHIAGVINPPAKKKRSYWSHDETTKNGKAKSGAVVSAQQWLAAAQEHAGSWWPEWNDFLRTYAGKKIAAPTHYGNAEHVPIEAAPGRYVKIKT